MKRTCRCCEIVVRLRNTAVIISGERIQRDMKALKITGKVLLYILVTVVLLLLVLRLGVTVFYFDYFNHSQSEFMIPGLSSAWAPQGFDYMEERGTYVWVHER